MICLMCCVQEVVGLKEEDLLNDTSSSSHTAGTGDPSRIPLSESQYTHVHKLFNVTVVLLYTGIADLAQVKRFLRNVSNWQSLGLQLGLLHPTLKRIEEEQHEHIDKCKTEMLAAWLRQKDNAFDPCCADLKTALKNIGQKQVASEINL